LPQPSASADGYDCDILFLTLNNTFRNVRLRTFHARTRRHLLRDPIHVRRLTTAANARWNSPVPLVRFVETAN
jgi:hypothetical protein